MSMISFPTPALPFVVFLLFSVPIHATGEGVYSDSSLPGVYARPGHRAMVITRWGSRHYLIDRETGEARGLTQEKEDVYGFGLARSVFQPEKGTVLVHRGPDEEISSVEVRGEGLANGRYVRRLYRFDNFVLEAGEVRLSGTLLRPLEAAKGPLALLLAGQGPNDRLTMLVEAADLLEAGLPAVIFDQRNAGLSSGPDQTRNLRDYVQLLVADAVAVAQFVIDQYPEVAKDGIALWGHSTGGTIAPLVARRMPEVRGMVNMAGNMMPGWRQWRYRVLSHLKRSGHAADVPAAADYLDVLFGAGLGTVSWQDYSRHLSRVSGEPWFEVAGETSLMSWESEESARAVMEPETYDPADWLTGVTIPSLGLFFEHDASTPPDSASVFVGALTRGGAGDVTVRMFPGMNHGLWEVRTFATDRGTIRRRSTLPGQFAVSWLQQIGGSRQ